MNGRPWSRVYRTTVALAIGALAASAPLSAAAQVSLEGRLGAAVPIGDLTDGPAAQTAGIAAAGALYYTFQPNLSFYGEASGVWFNCDGCPDDATSWGFDGGLKYVLAGEGAALPWIRAGLAVQQVSAGDGDGEWGVGLDSGVGIDWALTEQFYLVPAVRFDTYSPTEGFTVSWFTIDLGAHWHPSP